MKRWRRLAVSTSMGAVLVSPWTAFPAGATAMYRTLSVRSARTICAHAPGRQFGAEVAGYYRPGPENHGPDVVNGSLFDSNSVPADAGLHTSAYRGLFFGISNISPLVRTRSRFNRVMRLVRPGAHLLVRGQLLCFGSRSSPALVPAAMDSATAPDARSVDPRALALQLGDLPPHFVLMKGVSGYRSDAVSARQQGVPLSTLRREGRIDGYAVQYQRSDMLKARTLPRGLTIVESEVTTWTWPAGAHWGFGFSERRARGFRSDRFLSFGAVGNERYAYELTESMMSAPLSAYVVVFRQGRVLAAVTVAGKTGTVSLRTLVPYVRVDDARIRRKV